MQKKQHRPHLRYLLLSPILAIATVTLRTLSLLTAFDAESGFYTSTTLPTVSAIILILATAGMATFAYEMRSTLSFRRDYRDLPTLFSGAFLAIALVFFGVTMLLALPADSILLLLVSLLPILFALTGSVLFIVRAFDGSAEGGTKAMLTLPLAAFGAFYALYLSIESTTMMNAPAKLIAIPAWIAATLFFLGEARIALGRAKWALHSFSTVVTVIFTATLSIPNLVHHAVAGTPLLGNTAHDFVALGVFLYALAALFTTVTAEIRKQAPDTATILGIKAKVEETEEVEETEATDVTETAEETEENEESEKSEESEEENDEEATDR